ncbi:MAG: nuclear transport factor 2 family protein [Ilumatobacteraceae bacterium]
MTDAAGIARAYLASFAGEADSAVDVQELADAVAAHVAPGFHNEHASALGSSSTGRDEYRRRLPGFLSSFPGLAYEVETVIADGDGVAVAYRMTATSGGHPFAVRGVMLLEVDSGLITRRTDYWDSLGFLRQVAPEGRDVR